MARTTRNVPMPIQIHCADSGSLGRNVRKLPYSKRFHLGLVKTDIRTAFRSGRYDSHSTSWGRAKPILKRIATRQRRRFDADLDFHG